MAYNNTVTLIGNLGGEAKLYQKAGAEFASVSLATQDSYKNDQEEWITKDSVWHDLLIFSPQVLAMIKTLKTGARVKVTGTMSYRSFNAVLEDGTTVKKKETSIIIGKLELAPLAKKKS